MVSHISHTVGNCISYHLFTSFEVRDCLNIGLLCRLKDIKAWVDARDSSATVIPFSGAFEQKVSTKYIKVLLSLSVGD